MRAANLRSSSVIVGDEAEDDVQQDEREHRRSKQGRRHPKGDDRLHGSRDHRSTSPNTGSTDPMIATTSATLWPG